MSKKFKNKEADLMNARHSGTVATEEREGDETGADLGGEREAERGRRDARRRRGGEEEGEPRAQVEPWTMADPRYQYLAAAILVLGAGLRLVLLQAPPFMHDEGIHAMFAYNFSTYKYDPVYHGPLLYHLVALVFAVVGDYDFTARLVPALLGVGLMLLVIGPARRWLGDRAALWSLALIAVSPVMVTYQRRLLHDALVLLLTLGAVLCFQKARETASNTREGRLARLGLVALVALFLCTKANAFFIIAMLFSFGVAAALRRVWRGRRKFSRRAAFVPIAMLATVTFASMTAVPDEPNINRYERMFVLFCFVCSLVVWEWLRRAPLKDEPSRSRVAAKDQDGEREPLWLRFDWQTPVLAFGVLMLVLAVFYGNLYLWWREPGQIPRHLADIVDALPRMVSYWGGQQAKPRLSSRHDYFIVLMLIYELPIVIAAVAGFWRASRRRSPFTDLLLWWSFTSFTVYAMANEKVPWLMPHIILPFALLAGTWLANVRLTSPKKKIGFALAGVLAAVFLLRGVSATNFERGLDHHEPMFFAHTTEAFRDSFFTALEQNRDRKNWIWIDGSYQWPMAWYLRDSDKRYGAGVWWGLNPATQTEGAMRMAVASEPKYVNNPIFNGWHKWDYDPAIGRVVRDGPGHPDLAVWPRASWGALRLDRFPRFWVTRQASAENGVLFEDNHQSSVIATAP
ncbi:MAG TPA: flippase activity-associated protein Agl23 [Pyrinomonadaceae bacterium]|jgi:uncharacterized protein (TIGR03663 family)|nr:flippase activity-associated protein Agl23 [Pyrinomonadaceae bacterium]